MGFVYGVGIKIYAFLAFFFSFFNAKAKLWRQGQRKIFEQIQSAHLSGPTTWFHFASLGEFEQGRPVLERFKALFPQKKIVITFFSPSGYEIRKDSPLADLVVYLPLDTRKNARTFIRMINPELAVFTKYEYWYHFYKELHQNNIPIYVISAIFRKKQIFFKWYGFFNRKILGYVSHFFVQNERSKQLLKGLHLKNVTISGDTRFDRVYANAQNPKKIELVELFCAQQPVFIAGSTWPEDEKLIAELPAMYPDWKFIIAPHEISEEKINNLCQMIPGAARYSEIESQKSKVKSQNEENDNHNSAQILIIDNIGMLSSLYQYGNIVYIGGGFGAGIHNTLEAAAFGLPVIFGPNYHKFLEAHELIKRGAAFSIKNNLGLNEVMQNLQNGDYKNTASVHAADYVKSHIGATSIIIETITQTNSNLN